MGAVSPDDFYQGTKAAIAGGTTMISMVYSSLHRLKLLTQPLCLFTVNFVFPDKDETLVDAYHKWRTRATNKVCCDYALHVAIRSWSDEVKYKKTLVL